MTSVALIQLDVSSAEPVDSRCARALDMVAQAATRADLIVLPELWHVGAFDIPAAKTDAISLDGDLALRMSAAARAAGAWLHAGSFAELAVDGHLFNTSLVFDPAGERIATYRKVHLFGFESGEAAELSSGDELVCVSTPLGRTGLATCYDLRFPELFRALTDEGADSFVISSGWPMARLEHWKVLVRARAIENQAWVLACNEVGLQGPVGDQIALGGCSQVVSPAGDVVACADDSESILIVEVDASAAEQLRTSFPVLRDMRIHGSFTS